MATGVRATGKEIRQFFESDPNGSPMKLQELLELKKEDPDGYNELATGIGEGTFTY